MPDVLVGIGSNVDPEHALRLAVAALERHFGDVRTAGIYRSADARGAGADYLNTVAAFTTALSPSDVVAALGAAESSAGRQRADPSRCRLDLDLLLYGRRVDPQRGLPRPGFLAQPFVLGPLAEIAPSTTHPLFGVGFAAAWCEAGWNAPVVRLGAFDALLR